MHSGSNHRARIRLLLSVAAAAVPCSIMNLAHADDSWTGISGNWSDGGNWSENTQPVSTDSVYISNNDSTSRVITLDTNSAIDDFMLGNSGTGVNELDMSSSFTLQIVNATLAANALVQQSAGTMTFAANYDNHEFTSLLNVGTGAEYDLSGSARLLPPIIAVDGTFNQNAGTLTTSTLDDYGTFNQNGGTVTASSLVATSGNFTLNAGTLNITGAEYIGLYSGNSTLTQNGGLHTATGSLNVGRNAANGTLAINAGNLTVNGNVSIGGNDQYYQPGSGTIIVAGGAMTVSGSTTVSATGNLIQSGGAFQTGSLINAGTFSISNSNAVIGTGAGATALTNTGTIYLHNATVNVLGAADLPGTIISDPSTITFNAGLTIDSTGVIQLGAGDKWVFAGGNFVDNSTNTGNSVTGATIAFTSGGTQNLVLSTPDAMSLQWGALDISSSTSLDVTDGGSNPATLTVDDVIVEGNSLPNLAGVDVVGAATLSGAQSISTNTSNPSGQLLFWSDPGNFTFSGGATYSNAGTFNDENDRTYTGSGDFQNSGTYRKQASGGTTAFDVPFSNTGLVEVHSGTLQLNAGGDDQGVFTVSGGATLDFHAGTHFLLNPTSFGGAGNVNFSGATINADDLAFSPNASDNLTVNITDGTVNSYGAVNGGSVGATTINHSGGLLQIGEPSTPANLYLGQTAGSYANYNLRGSGSLNVFGSVNVGGTGGTLGGAGILTVTGGSMSVSDTLEVGAAGTVSVSGVTISVGTLTLDAQSTTIIGRSSGSAFGSIAASGNMTLSGVLAISDDAADEAATTAGQTFNILTTTGQISGAFSNIASGHRLTTTDGKASYLVTYDDGSDVVLSEFEDAPAPEPTTVAIIGLGSMVALLRRRRGRACKPLVMRIYSN